MDSDTTPYGEMDLPIVELCKTLNSLPGIRTVGSCGGHPEPVSHASAQPGEWWVTFRCDLGADDRPTLDGWLSAEYVAWAFYDLGKADKAAWMSVFSPPPWVNEPGKMLTFQLEGRHQGKESMHPDEIAEFMERTLDAVAASPEETDNDAGDHQ